MLLAACVCALGVREVAAAFCLEVLGGRCDGSSGWDCLGVGHAGCVPLDVGANVAVAARLVRRAAECRFRYSRDS